MKNRRRTRHKPVWIYEMGLIYCNVCGARRASYYHYVQMDVGEITVTAPHPTAPLLCKECAFRDGMHGALVCAPWPDCNCVVSAYQITTNLQTVMDRLRTISANDTVESKRKVVH